MRPLGPLATNCLNDAAKAGDPGVGPMTRAGFETDFHYVDGTPVMATLYGLDVLAQARWGKMPDLVISGPNEGRNVGTMIVSSGTVSNVQYSTARGVPSIAVSAGTNSVDNAKLANPNSALVAERTAELVGKLFANKTKGALLPTGIALNINLPDDVAKANWKATRIGSYEIYDIRFAADMGKSEAAAAFGLGGVHKPGMVLGFNKTPPRADQSDDEAGISLTHISISAVQIGYEPGARQNPDKWLRRLIKKLDGK
jgi:5'-nucleotidase